MALGAILIASAFGWSFGLGVLMSSAWSVLPAIALGIGAGLMMTGILVAKGLYCQARRPSVAAVRI